MDEKSAKTAKESAMLAVVPARDEARRMLVAIGGVMRWGENKERFRERCAWKLNHLSPVEFTLRRVRSILSNEKIKLDADEYLAIERVYERATQDVETLQRLARDAALRAGLDYGAQGGSPEEPCGPDHAEERPGADAAVRPDR